MASPSHLPILSYNCNNSTDCNNGPIPQPPTQPATMSFLSRTLLTQCKFPFRSLLDSFFYKSLLDSFSYKSLLDSFFNKLLLDSFPQMALLDSFSTNRSLTPFSSNDSLSSDGTLLHRWHGREGSDAHHKLYFHLHSQLLMIKSWSSFDDMI